MSLYRRKDSPFWWVKINHKHGCLQRSTGTSDRRRAQEYHDKLKAALWDQERLGVKPRHTWNDAVVRFVAETSHKASSACDKLHLRWLDRYLNGVDLRTIDRDWLDRLTAAKRDEGVSNASVNRMLEVVRAILRKAAYEWEWLDRAPLVRMLPEPKRRIRWITHEEAEADRGVAGALGGDGAIQPGDGTAEGQRHGAGMVSGGSGAADRLGPPGPGEGQEGYRSPAVVAGNGRAA